MQPRDQDGGGGEGAWLMQPIPKLHKVMNTITLQMASPLIYLPSPHMLYHPSRWELPGLGGVPTASLGHKGFSKRQRGNHSIRAQLTKFMACPQKKGKDMVRAKGILSTPPALPLCHHSLILGLTPLLSCHPGGGYPCLHCFVIPFKSCLPQ